MKKCNHVKNATVSLNGDSGSNENHQVSHREKTRGCMGKKALGNAIMQSTDVDPRSHKRRWSIDLSKHVTSEVIVRKNEKQPQPPQRGVSLSQTQRATNAIPAPPFPVHFSSSSSSNSSCSSPPPVKTSVITGPDPLGWKLGTKSNATSLRAHTKRLSLQIPFPSIANLDDPEPKTFPTPMPALRPKALSRQHSDTSVLIHSFETKMLAVTLEELCAVRLHPIDLSEQSDDVFVETIEQRQCGTNQPHKIPPAVPEKTAMARQVAQLIACSRQRWTPRKGHPKEGNNGLSSMMKA